IEPVINEPEPIKFVFPNDIPTVKDNLNTIIDTIYKKYYYEITDKFKSSDGTSWGLNRTTYFVSGLTSTGDKFDPGFPLSSFSQYNQGGVTDQLGETLLNKNLKEV